MKIKMLQSKKAKTSQSGSKFITIPFRAGVSTTIGDSEFFTNIMSPTVYKIAKTLQGKQQIKQGQLSGADAIPQTREFVKNQTQIFEGYTHKSSIYSGLQKGQGQYYGQYQTFRRISNDPKTGSNPNAFIHSGIKAYKLADIALENMDIIMITDKTIADFLNQKFG
jgi:hypothetical protein